MRFAMLSTGLACVAMVLLLTPAGAKARKADHASHSGTFVSASGGKLVMTGRDGKEHTHSLAKNVKVTIDGKSGALAGLKKGMQITVTTDKTGTVMALTTPPVKSATTTKPVGAIKPATAVKAPLAGAGK